jgi:hypothetical protein
MFKTNQPKETMKTIKIEYQSAWHKPEVFEFEVKNMKLAIDICEAGISQQYIVLVNGQRYRSLRSFGKTINLNN